MLVLCSFLSAARFKINATLHVQPKQLPRSWFNSQSSPQRKPGTKPKLSQRKIAVYRIAALKATTHQERGLDTAVKRALKEVQPQVVEYTSQNKFAGRIWAQIRGGFHRSYSSTSNSPHVTIRLYDNESKHIGGVHAPENPKEAATFKGGINKRSYYGERKIEKKFAFATSMS